MMPGIRILLRRGLVALVLALCAPVLYAQAPPPPTTRSEAELVADVEQARRVHGEVSEQHVIALRELAEFYWSEQRLDHNARTLEKAVAIAEQGWPDSFGLSRLMQNLATSYTTNGEPQRAQPWLHRALAIREKLRGPEHTDLAVILLNLGDSYQRMGDFAAALPPMLRALAIREKGLGPDHPDVAWATSFIGRLYREVGDYARALPYFERTLAVRRKALGDEHRFVSRSLTDLALLHRDMGNFAAARPLLERALELDRANLGPDHPDLVNALSSLGLLLYDMGEYAQALPLFERALEVDIRTAGPQHKRVAGRLNDLGLLYRALGDSTRAGEMYRRALAIDENQSEPQRSAIATRLHNLGVVHAQAGDHESALPLFERSLALDESVFGAEHPRVASTIASLALLHRDTGRVDLATKQIERAVAIEEKSGGSAHPRLARVLVSAAAIHESAGAIDAAQRSYRRALAIAARGDQPDSLWRIQRGMAALAARRGETDLSIHWGKSAVNTIQSLRGRLTLLSPELQKSFLTDKRAIFTALADQLIAVGRLAEAQEVMSMLKEEELYDFTARSTGEETRSTRASLVGPAENAAQRRWTEISDQLAQLGRESADLTLKARLGTLTAGEQARRVQVDADLVLANQRFDRFLAELSQEFATAGARRAEELGGRQLRNLVVMQDVLAELGRDTVLLHYVVAEQRVAIIVTTADVQIARESKIGAAELNRKVLAFRLSLAARRDVQRAALELHRILIEPVAADLLQAGARTLMLSLDGALRYLPFAALHDGRRYLIETYALAIYTEAARAQLTRKPQRDWSMTGLGVTRPVPGFAPLPGVRDELEGIRRNALRGDLFFDEQFTVDRLRDRLAASAPVMHIASHFQFRPGTFANSFLLLGDGGRLTLQEIRDRRLRFSSVELLTLSACDTAMGGGVDETGAEVEGFGALAQQQGASAVLATLWPVADNSTGQFMQIVYGGRQADRALSKAEALRRAQLAFLRGTSSGKNNKPEARLAHPFYWAPYVLMGNWL